MVRRATGTTYRYQPRPDHNTELREKLVALARQKPRYGYRRLGALLEKGGVKASPQRVYRVYSAERLAVRRLKRKRLVRQATEGTLLTPVNQELAIDFVADGLGTGRGIRMLTVVDSVHAGVPSHRGGHEPVQPPRDACVGSGELRSAGSQR
jgi:putative transposase